MAFCAAMVCLLLAQSTPRPGNEPFHRELQPVLYTLMCILLVMFGAVTWTNYTAATALSTDVASIRCAISASPADSAKVTQALQDPRLDNLAALRVLRCVTGALGLLTLLIACVSAGRYEES